MISDQGTSANQPHADHATGGWASQSKKAPSKLRSPTRSQKVNNPEVSGCVFNSDSHYNAVMQPVAQERGNPGRSDLFRSTDSSTHQTGMADFSILGPYRVEAKLGQGGMGSVYRGVHVKTGQNVAIKVLANQMSEQLRFRTRFANEIETLKKLNHPNIVRLIGFGEEEGSLFYSMELVEGPSLLEHLRKVKRLDWDTSIGYAIEICSALKHAHDFGVIHRDLKPANLLIDPSGQLKLTDFGIAKLFGASEHTAAGSVLGTADYMAPEQASGGKITPRTDLYALGSLLYACLAGRPPFGGRNLTQVIHGLKHESPAPLDLVLPDVPPELAELVHELLEKEPEARPPTALVVSKRLAAMRAGLRNRGSLTQADLGNPTLPETAESFVSDSVPRSKQPADPDVANLPTAAESDSSAVTGGLENRLGTLPTAASNDFELSPPAVVEKRTHFESVPDSEKASEAWRGDQEGRGAGHWASLIGLAAALVVIVGFTLWVLQPTPAAELLVEIEQYDQQGDTAAANNTRREFLSYYPDHPNATEVKSELQGDDVDRRIRQITAKSKRLGGMERQPIVQQAWLEAMSLRRSNPGAAANLLRSWLDVYDHPEAMELGGGGDVLEELLPLARSAYDQLLESGEASEDARITELRSWLQWGIDNLQGEERERFIAGARQIYGDQSWAIPVLNEMLSE